jgi:putative tryptophan/tyrosine transport system substrate-binding protein
VLVQTRSTEAQNANKPRVGFLSPAEGPGANHAAFRQRLSAMGFEEGKNIQIEWRWLSQQYAQLPMVADELVDRKVDAIVAQTQAAALAAKKATSAIPIIFVGVRDPVRAGLVQSMHRPGENATGVTLTPSWELPAKQIELLREIRPDAARFAIFWNPRVSVQAEAIEEIKRATKGMGVDIPPFPVVTATQIRDAFVVMHRDKIDGLLTLVESFTLSQRALIAQLATQFRIPTAFEVSDYVQAGGLLSYGLRYHEHYAEAATYLVKVLRGASPHELPVQEPIQFELVINRRTADALGLTIPPTLLARADEVY